MRDNPLHRQSNWQLATGNWQLATPATLLAVPSTIANPADLQALKSRIASLTSDTAPQWGDMTAAQAVCHMTDSLLYGLNRRTIHTRIKSPLPVGLYKWLALNFPTKWPKGVPTTPEMKQGVGGTPPAEFQCDRETLLQALDAFAANRGNWPPHPIFAGMTTREWHRWAWLHTDHHLRQFGR